jgi:putative endonuclease
VSGERSLAAAQGRVAEQAACDYLLARGLTLHSRNYRCRGGELDLIMHEGKTVVFVEVRYRSSTRFGGAAASIDATKQQKLLHAAQTFLSEHRLSNIPCRFDVVTVSPQNGELDLQWIQNAITAD